MIYDNAAVVAYLKGELMNVFRKYSVLVFISATSLFAGSAAMATTNCTNTVHFVYTDANNVVLLPNGMPQTVIPVTANGVAARAYAGAMTAAVAGKTITVVYAADNVPCVDGVSRTDFVALFVNF